MKYLTKNEIAFKSKMNAIDFMSMMADEDYVVMMSREDNLYIVNWEYSQYADRNDVVFMSREQFEDEWFSMDDTVTAEAKETAIKGLDGTDYWKDDDGQGWKPF